MKTHPIQRAAQVSECGRYRYQLARWWDETLPRVLFVMLNPSSADGVHEDATSRRCIGFSRMWGYGGFYVVNLFAWRATKPRELLFARNLGEDIVGPLNLVTIGATVRLVSRIVVAWGAPAERHAAEKRQTITTLLTAQPQQFFCLGMTERGEPRHPLRLASSTALRPLVFEERPLG